MLRRRELTTSSQTIGIYQAAFDNLRVTPLRPMCGVAAVINFTRTLAMKTERLGHNAATQALVLTVAGVMTIGLIASLILLILY